MTAGLPLPYQIARAGRKGLKTKTKLHRTVVLPLDPLKLYQPESPIPIRTSLVGRSANGDDAGIHSRKNK